MCIGLVCTPLPSGADYCAQTLPQLSENIKKYVDEANRDAIELETVADAFLTTQATAIKTLVRRIVPFPDRCVDRSAPFAFVNTT